MGIFKFRKHSLDLGLRTYVMGILNITPDSFSDGGRYFDADRALERALEIEALGADLIDIGAQSTAPSSSPLDTGEELARLSTSLKAISKQLKIPISVDTYHPQVARFALENGAHIINDISASVSPEMAEIVAHYGAGWVIMHNRCGADAIGNVYEGGVINHVRSFFEESMQKALAYGLSPEQLCFDPGIGFGKSMADNLSLIKHMADIKLPTCALLTGLSRKRVLGSVTGESVPKKRDAAGLAAHTVAIAQGTDIIRAHNVADAIQGARMAHALCR